MSVQLPGARVLLTGASGGIGQAIARALHARGAALMLTGRRADALEPLAAEVSGTAIAADLGSADGVRRLLDEAKQVDILVANAALPGSGYLLDYSDEEIDQVLAVNLRTPVIMTRHLVPQMRERGGGHIVFIGSLSSKAAAEQSALYSATKFGLRGFSLALRQDLHGTGVGVSIVLPGFVRDAGMYADAGAPSQPGVRTVSPQAVARGVLRAITQDRAEIAVAPPELRAGATIAAIAPQLAATLQRRTGGSAMAAVIAEGHQAKGKRT
ncbi:MAG TPA: SDR family NAD(P)-dependent oxidoreductase [Streptosporangiaceae bacterium]|jgi:short-subunit dehydrogenase